MAGSRAQQAAIAISMKKAGKVPKAQKGISVQTVSPTDPYEVYKRKLQSDSSKVELDKRKKLKTLEANTKLKKAEAAARARARMQKGGSPKPYTLDPGFSKPVPKDVRNIDPGFTKKLTKEQIKNLPKPKFDKNGRVLYKEGGSTPAWQRKEGKSPSGGLNAKGRASLKAAGHDIKAPQPEGGPRKKSFCARMSGMKKKLTSAKTANDPNSRINKSLRKWKC